MTQADTLAVIGELILKELRLIRYEMKEEVEKLRSDLRSVFSSGRDFETKASSSLQYDEAEDTDMDNLISAFRSEDSEKESGHFFAVHENDDTYPNIGHIDGNMFQESVNGEINTEMEFASSNSSPIVHEQHHDQKIYYASNEDTDQLSLQAEDLSTCVSTGSLVKLLRREASQIIKRSPYPLMNGNRQTQRHQKVGATKTNATMSKTKSSRLLDDAEKGLFGRQIQYSESVTNIASSVKSKRGKSHPCPFCNKLFSSSELTRHIRVHTGERPFRCNICFKAFKRQSHLKRHNQGHFKNNKNMVDHDS